MQFTYVKSVCVCVSAGVCTDNNARRYRNGEVIFVRVNFCRFVFVFAVTLALALALAAVAVAFAFAMFGGL